MKPKNLTLKHIKVFYKETKHESQPDFDRLYIEEKSNLYFEFMREMFYVYMLLYGDKAEEYLTNTTKGLYEEMIKTKH